MQNSLVKRTETPNQAEAARKVFNAIRSLNDPEGSSISEIKKCLNSRSHVLQPDELSTFLKDAIDRGKMTKNGRKYKIIVKEKKEMPVTRAMKRKEKSEDTRKPLAPKKLKETSEDTIKPLAPKKRKKASEDTLKPLSPKTRKEKSEDTGKPLAPNTRKEKSDDSRKPLAPKKRKETSEDTRKPLAPKKLKETSEDTKKMLASKTRKEKSEDTRKTLAPKTRKEKSEDTRKTLAPKKSKRVKGINVGTDGEISNLAENSASTTDSMIENSNQIDNLQYSGSDVLNVDSTQSSTGVVSEDVSET